MAQSFHGPEGGVDVGYNQDGPLRKVKSQNLSIPKEVPNEQDPRSAVGVDLSLTEQREVCME